MKKMKYVAPQTKSSEVELENNFCGSVVPKDEQETPTISINNQEIGAESDYFTQDAEWDY